ncbi:TRAP transporter small permease [Paenibacillus tarimensis]|uniref:TRAP transporter small permease n=1 Tax=Paenibacillus tarimensis TaxID=416012 RepID=UPI001F24E315|nr:TRAP transporter small permease [Paenibacillus tarimensis]MCF2944693.1 TRAP transporter small permease [Paenibacillus tarimensis]
MGSKLLRGLRAAALQIDKAVEAFAVSAVALMTIIVTVQVITRKVFNFVFFWSEEITLLLLIWFSFLGIAIGFREKLHLAMDAVAKRLPAGLNKALDYIIGSATLLFGGYLILYGWEFTVLMHNNTMTATDWPSSVMYIIMPVTGLMICVYTILQLAGVDTVRHRHLDEEVQE